MNLYATRGSSIGRCRSPANSSVSVWVMALLLCWLCILSSGFLGESPLPISHRLSSSMKNPSCHEQPPDCGLLLARDSRTPLSFSCRRCLSILPPLLLAAAGGDPTKNSVPPKTFPKTFGNLLRRKKKMKQPSTRTSSYLITMDKRRGYHRKTLGGLAQVVNNTDVNIMSPPEVASAIVGRFSSEAFK